MRLLTQMITIRRMETAANEEYRKKSIRGFLHLYSGQEACAVGIRSEMTDNDTVMTAYRCHGWAYLMGVKPLGVLAELFGQCRQTLCADSGLMRVCRSPGWLLHGQGRLDAHVCRQALRGLRHRRRPGMHSIYIACEMHAP